MTDLLQQLNTALSAAVEGVRQGVVQISNGHNGAGAGTVWHPDGLIVTNAHVVQRPSLHVMFPDGRKLPARVLATDERLDVAAVAVDATGLPTVELGDSRRLRPGQWVLAIGHPWGVVGAVTAGIVIDVGVPLEMVRLGRELIQVDLHLRPGYSGGPLVDARGRVVGINSMMSGPDVGLAVPVHVVKAFLRQVLELDAEAAIA